MKKIEPVLHSPWAKAGSFSVVLIIFFVTLFIKNYSDENDDNKKELIKRLILTFDQHKQKTKIKNKQHNSKHISSNKIFDQYKQKIKNTNNKIKPLISKLRPKLNFTKLKQQENKDIVKATSNIAFSSTSQGILLSTNNSGQTIIIGSSNANIGTNNTNGTSQSFTLAKYTTNGQLDNSFGTKGIASTDFLSTLTNGSASGSTDIPVAFAIQPNGSMLVAGNSNANLNIDGSSFATPNTTSFALARYRSNGNLDTTFGTNGVVVTNIGLIGTGKCLSTDNISAISLLSNGKILVAGTTNYFGNNSFVVARYLNNGQLDTSFGTNGISSNNIAFTLNSSLSQQPSIDNLTGMSILPNGKIVLSGTSNYLNPNSNFATMRLNSNGQLDTSFNQTGIVLTNPSTSLSPIV